MIYTWRMFDEDINRIVNRIHNHRFSGVYGVPRGGLPLAVVLSHKLKLPLLLAPCSDCLICDDIADSGKTLKQYNNKYFTAVLIHKYTTETKPNVHGRMYWEDDWVIFPWEK